MSSNETTPAGFKPKKSVALSGVTAGNTALCNRWPQRQRPALRGYDILDLADQCEFEEVAHLLCTASCRTPRNSGATRPS